LNGHDVTKEARDLRELFDLRRVDIGHDRDRVFLRIPIPPHQEAERVLLMQISPKETLDFAKALIERAYLAQGIKPPRINVGA
jgi:hypothetical protein